MLIDTRVTFTLRAGVAIASGKNFFVVDDGNVTVCLSWKAVFLRKFLLEAIF